MLIELRGKTLLLIFLFYIEYTAILNYVSILLQPDFMFYTSLFTKFNLIACIIISTFNFTQTVKYVILSWVTLTYIDYKQKKKNWHTNNNLLLYVIIFFDFFKHVIFIETKKSCCLFKKKYAI